jgi:hypothetical protein
MASRSATSLWARLSSGRAVNWRLFLGATLIALPVVTGVGYQLLPAAGAREAGSQLDAAVAATTVVDTTANSPLRIISIARNGSDVVVVFEATQGVTYRLQRKLNITDATWQSIAGVNDVVASSNGPAQITDPGAISLGRAFYRVSILAVAQGGACTISEQCAGGLTCTDGVCCTGACVGTCERCDIAGHVGECWPVADGGDPDAECGSVSCSAYYHGWEGDTCYHKADVTAAQATCNGARACRDAAQECTAQTVRGPAQITCDSFCQDPAPNTCSGTTAGACINVSQGDATCGLGVCQTTAPRCVNGVPNECVPNNGAATTETCNGLDDNCDGIVDNGAFADAFEPNNDCNSFKTLPQVGSDQTVTQNGVTLYPSGDADYFRIPAVETDSSCACCDAFCTDEDYRLTVTLTVPADAGSYTFCAATACGNVTNNCRTVPAGSSASLTFLLDGACTSGSTDSYSLYVRVAAGSTAPGFNCAPYRLSYFFDAGVCL